MLRSAGSVVPPWQGENTSTSLAGAAAVFARCPGPRVMALAVAAPLIARVAFGSFAVAELIVVGGVMSFWIVFEWTTHRFSLHMKPRTMFGKTFDPFFARRHRFHHREPWRLEETLLPLWVVIPAIPSTAALWWLVLPSTTTWLTAVTTFNAMALVYEWIHYLIHTPYQPRSALYREMVREHRLHHFKNERFWFCSTLPWLDHLLGTNPDPSRVDRSPTARTLGVEERT